MSVETLKKVTCCDQPDLTFTWYLGERNDGQTIVAIENAFCRSCQTKVRFDNDLVVVSADQSAVILEVELRSVRH